MSVTGIGMVSATATWKTVKWLFQLPPRVFSWAMDNKIKTLLLVGALYYAQGSVKNWLAERDLEQRKEVLDKKVKENLSQIRKQPQKPTKKPDNLLSQMKFRNIPQKKATVKPKTEDPKITAQKKQQEQLTRDGINAIRNHTLSSLPVFKPMPVTEKER